MLEFSYKKRLARSLVRQNIYMFANQQISIRLWMMCKHTLLGQLRISISVLTRVLSDVSVITPIVGYRVIMNECCVILVAVVIGILSVDNVGFIFVQNQTFKITVSFPSTTSSMSAWKTSRDSRICLTILKFW